MRIALIAVFAAANPVRVRPAPTVRAIVAIVQLVGTASKTRERWASTAADRALPAAPLVPPPAVASVVVLRTHIAGAIAATAIVKPFVIPSAVVTTAVALSGAVPTTVADLTYILGETIGALRATVWRSAATGVFPTLARGDNVALTTTALRMSFVQVALALAAPLDARPAAATAVVQHTAPTTVAAPAQLTAVLAPRKAGPNLIQ